MQLQVERRSKQNLDSLGDKSEINLFNLCSERLSNLPLMEMSGIFRPLTHHMNGESTKIKSAVAQEHQTLPNVMLSLQLFH